MDTKARFEPVSNTHHRTELIRGTEWTIVSARKNWFALPFLCIWITGWTFGGIAALYALFDGQMGERLFLSVWLVGWALGWMSAASFILWQIGGRSMVAVTDGALVHAWQMPFISREKRYDAAQVRNLRSADAGGLFGFGRSMRDAPPFLPSTASGSVKFDYGARTVQIFPGLDEAEGRIIVERLARKLPRTAATSR